MLVCILKFITDEGVLPQNSNAFRVKCIFCKGIVILTKILESIFALNLLNLCPHSSDLKRSIENLEKNNVTNLRTLVNLGSEVYMQADVYVFIHSFMSWLMGIHEELAF